ncbi:swi5-dependent recombination DNA repair protein 1 homolog isoform X1 [Amphibalanus amphitrite]|uniref:swi5-dependent recombination DNA repair protein 1 homolog isoform X1 n=1 Tax=Amphibalanus amphitrite TaxID=1232801 RepID=UPI001C912B9C|nr:swi5-dependent recombination DNA repair protein 1 homolog isoform X1 [Amphibalanus amphitrite]XP_043245377.1 swi5-dependent recombination DNA repair protein 1 homolog isoform X1 [Amphibalanus amphitrite]
MSACDSTPLADSSAESLASASPSHGASGGTFNTPVIRKRSRDGPESSEPRPRFKRRQLSLANAELREKEDKLQKLRLVNHYRQNHSLPELARLTGCWREAAQQALAELQQRLEARGQPTDMAQLLRHLGIDPHLVRYDTEGQEFLPPNGT